MGESLCVVHSFPCASTISHEPPKECFLDDPLDALTDSISLGKFMTESLDWGKWSTFSQKKYVEEAEKYSQPGAVAEKKALFEARYKKIAAAKKAAAAELLEQQEHRASENVYEQEVKEQETEMVEAVRSELNIEKIDVVVNDPVAEEEIFVDNSTRVMDANESIDVVEIDAMKQEETHSKYKDNKDEGKEMFEKPELISKNDEELVTKSESIEKKNEDIEALNKNVSDSLRLSEKNSTPVNTMNVVANHSFSDKISERKEQAVSGHPFVRKPATRKWSFSCMRCFWAPFCSKTHDQQARTEQEISKKKSRKLLCGICFNPKFHQKASNEME